MKRSILGMTLAFAFVLGVPQASALSCLPTDMYLESVVGDETTLVFAGTATPVKNHAQVVTVSKSLQGWVAPTLWVEHPYSTDWQYFCSNGPAKTGESTVFLVTVNEYGTFSVTQTLPANSDLAKELIKDLSAAKVDAGITETTPEGRANELRDMMSNLIKALLNMLAELKHWEGVK